MTITIWHNLACGTSRNTLALVRVAGVEPKVVKYRLCLLSREKLDEVIHA